MDGNACSTQRRRAHATTASWWKGVGNLAGRLCGGGAWEEASELRSDGQAEARPTKVTGEKNGNKVNELRSDAQGGASKAFLMGSR